MLHQSKETAEKEKALEWVIQIVRELERCEDELPEPEYLQGEYPQWVKNISREIVLTLFPVARLNREKPWTPREAGAMAGHKLALLRGIEDAAPLHIPETPELSKPDKELEQKMERWVRGWIAGWIETEICVGKALALAAEQPHHEAKPFFSAFAKAYEKKPVDLAMSNFHRTSTRVYILMYVGWRSVEKMQNVAELHRALCRFMEPHLVGDMKRLEKLCQRLGLRFAGRGRPKKSEIQTFRFRACLFFAGRGRGLWRPCKHQSFQA